MYILFLHLFFSTNLLETFTAYTNQGIDMLCKSFGWFLYDWSSRRKESIFQAFFRKAVIMFSTSLPSLIFQRVFQMSIKHSNDFIHLRTVYKSICSMKPNFDKFQSSILRYDQSFQCCTTRKYDSTTRCKLNVYRHHIQDYIKNMRLGG